MREEEQTEAKIKDFVLMINEGKKKSFIIHIIKMAFDEDLIGCLCLFALIPAIFFVLYGLGWN